MGEPYKMEKKSRPLCLKLLVPIIALILVEIALLMNSIFGGGLIEYMENNDMEILHEHVVNRQRYLQTEMLTRWSKVETTAEQINAMTQSLLEKKEITLEQLDNGSAECLSLLDTAMEPLIRMLRDNKVTGAFLVLNTDDLEKLKEQGIYRDKPGIYIRDYDPESKYSDRNVDLLMEYAPSEIVKKRNISLDSGWKPLFVFETAGEYSPYLYETYQAALQMEERLDLELSDMGYWSEAHHLYGDDLEVISYSVPLILEDGTVYGVLGVDLSLNYLETLLPAEELKDEDSGSYLLGIEKGSETTITNVLITGSEYSEINDGAKETRLYQENGRWMVENAQGKDVYCEKEYISLYNTNTAFSEQKWVLTGIIQEKNLFVFSDNVKTALMRGILETLLAGVLGGILISIYISRPVAVLTKSVRKMKPLSRIAFPKTGIKEIDLVADELEHLNQETLYTAERFSYIINTAKLQLALFEVNSKEKRVFITGRFFEMLHLEECDFSSLTDVQFWEMLRTLEPYRQDVKQKKDLEDETEILYKFQDEDTDQVSYIKITIEQVGNRCIGLVEDTTDMIMEKETIKYERDHDLLCGLLNRRAFNRIMMGLFKREVDSLRTAAFIMVDLDGLKQINDTYGHEYGDKYIQTAAQSFVKYTPKNTIICRRSGDEFYLFFYGYETKEEIRVLIRKLQKEIEAITILLPDEKKIPLRMSAGIAWYPDDTTVFQKLRSYADYAMYQIKHGEKDQFGEFDKEKYLQEQNALETDK